MNWGQACNSKVRHATISITSGMRVIVIGTSGPSHLRHQRSGHTKWDTWTIVESLDTVTHDSLLHYDVHYAMDCGSLLAVHNACPHISI